MLLISLARRVTAPRCRCSASPFNAVAYARQCSSVACRINALASLCTCFFAPRFPAPLHVLWPLIPRSAGQPQPCQSLSSLRRRRVSPHFSIAEHSLADAERICSAAYRVISHLLRCGSELFEAIARLLDAHRCNSSAIRVTAILLLSASVLGQSIAPQSSPLLFHRSARQSRAHPLQSSTLQRCAVPLPLCAMPLPMRRSS